MIRCTKRETLHRTQHNTTQHNTPEKKIEISNRYGLLTNETNKDSIDESPSSTKIHKTPLLFVHCVINYGETINRIRAIAEDEQYCTKCLAKMLL